MDCSGRLCTVGGRRQIATEPVHQPDCSGHTRLRRPKRHCVDVAHALAAAKPDLSRIDDDALAFDLRDRAEPLVERARLVDDASTFNAGRVAAHAGACRAPGQ